MWNNKVGSTQRRWVPIILFCLNSELSTTQHNFSQSLSTAHIQHYLGGCISRAPKALLQGSK